MTGNRWDISDIQLIKVLKTEFNITISNEDKPSLIRARKALFLYKNRIDFLKQNRWGQDNPELTKEEYLTENRICRWVNGYFVYFSRLMWEGDE